MTSVLSSLSLSCLLHIHAFMSSVHDCRSRVRLCTSFGGVDFWSWVLSAKRWWLTEWFAMMSESGVVYKTNSTGPSTEPCGTPNMWWLLACQSICSVISLHSGMSRAISTGVFEGGCWPLTHSSLGFPFHFSLFVAISLNLRWWWHVWSDFHFLKQSSGEHGWLLPPLWVTASTSMGDCFHLHCQAALSSWMVVAPFLKVKPHPDWALVTEPLVYTVLRFAVVVLWTRSLISDSVLPPGHSRQRFPKFSGRSVSQRRRNRFGYLSHSVVCLSSVSWHTCPLPVCIPLCLSRLRGDFRRHWSMLWLAPLSVWFALVGSLAWTSWSQLVSFLKKRKKKGCLPLTNTFENN